MILPFEMKIERIWFMANQSANAKTKETRRHWHNQLTEALKEIKPELFVVPLPPSLEIEHKDDSSD